MQDQKEIEMLVEVGMSKASEQDYSVEKDPWAKGWVRRERRAEGCNRDANSRT